VQIKAFPTHLGNLLVTDEFVPLQLQQALSELTRQPIWKYGWRSNNRRDRYCYWHAHVAGGDSQTRTNCESELAGLPAFSAIYALFKILQQGPLKGHEPVRVYMNSHTFGVEGYVHQDNADTENYFSTVYYAHPVWHQNWSGDTVFYNRDESDILTSVFPRPGRAVTFHGAIPHCARAPSRDCNELRVSIVIKTQRQALAASDIKNTDTTQAEAGEAKA
jgi:SM-20-related protein